MNKKIVSRGMARHRWNRSGFTLIELLVVIAIMGILATMTFTGVQQNLPRWRLNAAARMMRGDLVDSKSRAARDMREYRLHLSSTGYTMQIGNARAGSTSWVTPPQPAPPARDFTTDFPGVAITMTSSTVDPIFQPTGILQPGLGNLDIVITDSSGHTKTISISMPGRIRIS